MVEVWKDIPEYEGFYQASSLGRIRSVDHCAMHSRGHSVVNRKGRILAPQMDMYGYYRVPLSKLGKTKHHLVHRLVAITFIPNPDSLPIINHKDLNKTNNTVDNLEWVTQQENCVHAITNGHKAILSSDARKKVTQGAKAANSLPIICITIDEKFDSVTDASKSLGISKSAIIRSAKYNKRIRNGYEFRYLNAPTSSSTSIRIAPECLIK